MNTTSKTTAPIGLPTEVCRSPSSNPKNETTNAVMAIVRRYLT
jgi:hypothetical protein